LIYFYQIYLRNLIFLKNIFNNLKSLIFIKLLHIFHPKQPFTCCSSSSWRMTVVVDRVDGEGDGRAGGQRPGHRPAPAFDGVVATVCWMRHVPVDDHVVLEGLDGGGSSQDGEGEQEDEAVGGGGDAGGAVVDQTLDGLHFFLLF
jgi:hypothetical protein